MGLAFLFWFMKRDWFRPPPLVVPRLAGWLIPRLEVPLALVGDFALKGM